jgi:uncharacterized protein
MNTQALTVSTLDKGGKDMSREDAICILAISVMLAATLAASDILSAAPATGAAPAKIPVASPKVSPAGEMVKVFTIGMGTSGVGTVQTLSTGWSAIISKYGPFKSVVENSPTMKSKSQHITDGTIHSYMFSAQAPLDEYVGSGEAGKGVKTRIRTLTFSDYPASTILAFCTRPDSGVKTVKDLKGKVVFADYAPSPYMARMVEAVFALNGMTRKDCTWLKFTSSTDAFREIKEKRAQAIFFPMGVGSIDMAQTVGLFVIPFSEAEQKAIEKVTPAFYGYTISKGVNGANADTPVVASDLAIWIGPQVSEVTAYWAIRVLYDHLDEFHAVFPAAKGFTLQNACKGWVIPYHPGAILFFKEKGVWGAAEDKKQADLLAAEKKLFGDK